MGKLFIARLADGTERFAADLSTDRARLFYDLTKLLEQKDVPLPSGLADDDGTDEYVIDADRFVAFFVRFWEIGWLGEHHAGLMHEWACLAAGMIENIIGTRQPWIDRRGEALIVRQYRGPDE